MKKWLDAFRPNKSVARSIMLAIIAAEIGIGLAIWLFGPSKLIPRPLEVIEAFRYLWMKEGLSWEIWTSLKTSFEALAITTAISLVFAYLTVLAAMRPVAAFVSKGRFLGLIGLSFLFRMIFGGGHGLKVSLIVFGETVFFVTAMSAVVAAIPKSEYDHARTLRMSEWRVVWEVVIRGKRHEIFEAMIQNAAIGLMMVPMVEAIVRSEGGVGSLLLNQNKHFRLSEVFAIQFSILLMGLGQDYLLQFLKKMFCPYLRFSLERTSSVFTFASIWKGGKRCLHSLMN